MPMIFKIVEANAYDEARKRGQFMGAEIDLKDGYIHFSTAEQVRETAERHFYGRTNLVILAVDDAALRANLKWEPSRRGQLFPHLYAPLSMDLVRWVKPLTWDGTAHSFPPETFS